MKPLRLSLPGLISRYSVLLLALGFSAVTMAVVKVVHSFGIPVGHLTREPTIVGGLPAYVGAVSQIGIFLWAAAGTLCFFSRSILSNHAEQGGMRTFLTASGVLTLVLGLDDAFLLHEEVLPYFGVPQNLVLGSYMVLVLGYLFVFYRQIIKTDYIVLVIALAFFGGSVLLDVLHLPGINPYLYEDGAKLTGIAVWAAYFFRVGQYSVQLAGARQVAGPR